MLNILSILMGAVVLGVAIMERRSPVMTTTRLLSGIAVGAGAIVAGVSGLLA